MRIDVWSGIHAVTDKTPRRAGRGTSKKVYKPARRWQQDVISDARPVIRVVQGDGHPVHGNNFKRLPLNLQVEITVRGSIHETPKLALTRSDFNLRPYGSVQRKDLCWHLWLRTTNIRTEFNAMLQIGRLRIVHNGTATHNQDALRQAG